MNTTTQSIHERVALSFARQGMMQHMGAELRRVEPGLVEIWLPYSDKVTQQQDGFHGGGMGAVAENPRGHATAEYKINFLGSYQGGALRAIGRVVKPGKRLIVCTAEVTHIADDGKQGPCALMQQTLVPVPKTY